MSGLTYTCDATKAEECDRMLLLLNGLTWNGVNTSRKLALEVMSMLAAGRPYILAHESEAFEADQDRDVARYGVNFATFFDCTPKRLISSGLYHPIAVMLKGGINREASLTQLAAELVKPPKRVAQKLAREATKLSVKSQKHLGQMLGETPINLDDAVTLQAVDGQLRRNARRRSSLSSLPDAPHPEPAPDEQIRNSYAAELTRNSYAAEQ